MDPGNVYMIRDVATVTLSLETGEGHIWRNWRIYLTEFAPKLFK